ncbi:MAG: hypothetical protein QOE80_1376 [Actinomycetota bacterium]|jgi:hypothetical protein|nr:hypothetical protein [Actinomycetota bacterium]
MPKVAAFVVSLLLVLAASPAAMAYTAVPGSYDVVGRADLYQGVEYLKLAKPAVPVVAHVAHVLPGALVDLRVVNASDKIPTSSKELETTSSMCRRVRCVVGVDGDFHFQGTPAGGVISAGRMMRSPNPAHPQVTITRDGHLVGGPLDWTGSLTLGDGNRVPLSGVNVSRVTNGLVLYTPAFGSRTPISGNVELVVSAAEGLGTLNRASGLDLKGIRSGAGAIPANGAVLSGDGAAAQQLLSLWGRVAGSTLSPHAEMLVQSPVDAAESIGVEPVVLRDGRRALPWLDPNVVNPRQPHTLVGWNKAGDVYLVAVDGRQSESQGMTMAEAADFLLGLGVSDAVSLDGGGGTVFVAGGSVWNRPSDNNPADPTQYEERGAANALVVVARPGAPLPALSPPPPPKVDPGAPAAPDGSQPTGAGGAPLGSTAGSPAPGGGTAGEAILQPAGLDGATHGGSSNLFMTARDGGSKGSVVTGQEIAAGGDQVRGAVLRAKGDGPRNAIATSIGSASVVAGTVAEAVANEVARVRHGDRLSTGLGLTMVGLVATLVRRRRRNGSFAGSGVT